MVRESHERTKAPVCEAGAASAVPGMAEEVWAVVAMQGTEEEVWAVVAMSAAHFRSERKRCRR